MKKDLNKEFSVGIYCPPQAKYRENESRITLKTFKLLKEVGINLIFGYYEDENKELENALIYAKETGIDFYPRLSCFRKFLNVSGVERQDGNCSYKDLPKREQEKLKAEFLNSLESIEKYGFNGIMMGDESGFPTFAGIRAARDVFKSKYPDKKFCFNLVGPLASDDIYFDMLPKEKREFEFSGDLSDIEENRFNRYHFFMDKYIEETNPEMISADSYPYLNIWPEVTNPIHRVLYELNGLLSEYKHKYSLEACNYIQVGEWGSDNMRAPTEAEYRLSINVTLAYGLDGIYFFPGCFPNVWLDPIHEKYKSVGGLLNYKGEPTIYYGYTKKIIKDAQKCAPKMLGYDFKGVFTIGDFVGGFNGVDTKKLKWGSCIFDGTIPNLMLYKGAILDIKTSSQLFCGVFENEEFTNYYFVNNSVVTDVNFSVNIEKEWNVIRSGILSQGKGKIQINKLPAGDAVLVSIKK